MRRRRKGPALRRPVPWAEAWITKADETEVLLSHSAAGLADELARVAYERYRIAEVEWASYLRRQPSAPATIVETRPAEAARCAVDPEIGASREAIFTHRLPWKAGPPPGLA